MARCENCEVELDEEEAVEGLLGETLCPDCAERKTKTICLTIWCY